MMYAGEYLFVMIVLAYFELGYSESNDTMNSPKPTTTEVPIEYDSPEYRIRFANDYSEVLLSGCCCGDNCPPARDNGPSEYSDYTGWYNNVGRPRLGAVDTPLLRRTPAAYEDGVYKPAGSNRPNPFDLSDLLAGDIGSKSRTGKNALLVFFGQQVVEEILDAQRPACPPEYLFVDIPVNHTYREKTGHTKKPVLRTRYSSFTGRSPNNPRQQLNEITPFLDGGLIYGTSKARADVLRTYANGTFDPNGLLAFQLSPSGGMYPEFNNIRLPMANPPPPAHHCKYVKAHETEKVDRFFRLGNPRGNENPFLLSFGIIWFRWHNVIATKLKQLHQDWSGERIFNEARKWVIATQQHIVVNEWLPQWLGRTLRPYEGYDPSIDPQIDQYFQAAAFRFGHTLVPAGVYLRNYGREGCEILHNQRAIRTCNNYWMSQNAIFENLTKIDEFVDIERLIMGMSVQLCEEEDHKIVEDLRGSLFGPLEFSRRDLMVLNIMRARDHGVPDYNTARMEYNLHKVEDASHFSRISEKTKNDFIKLYNNSFDDIDIWVGGILETTDGPGELFEAIIADQFERIRAGDRFWYRNMKNGLFTPDEVKRLEILSFHNILRVTTQMDFNDIPVNPFKVPVGISRIHIHQNCKNILKEGSCSYLNGTKIPCFHVDPVNRDKVENCTDIGTYDYFKNSEISFIVTFLGKFLFFCVFIAIIMIKLRIKERRDTKYHMKISQSRLIQEGIATMFTANEWEGWRSEMRPVIIIFNIRSRQLEVKDQLGYTIRALDFANTDKVIIFSPDDTSYLLMRVYHNYDLVLKFDSEYLKNYFLQTFDQFSREIKVNSEIDTDTSSIKMLKQAITKKDRQKKLEKFFRVVFAQAFHIAHDDKEILQVDATLAKEVIYTELTISEFAEALSMRKESEFVKKMFNLVDKSKNGFVSFREFVDLLVIFLKGTAEDKLKLMFDMYDINGTGNLKMEDFTNMLRSFMETVKADIRDDELEAVMHSMMVKANIAKKQTLTLQDFQKLLNDFSDKISYAELEFNVSTDKKCKKLHASSSTVRSTFIGEVRKTVESLYADPNELKSRIQGRVDSDGENSNSEENQILNNNEKIVEESRKRSDTYWYPVMKYLANKRLKIFWVTLYTLVLLLIFFERVYYYSFEREHSGLRQILGYGLTLTRGAASAMMFTYSSLLFTMCHNTFTVLRDTVLQNYIPFDSMIDMHKYIAAWAFAFTTLHIIGHGFNFYHIATQPADDLTCLFSNYFHATHELPKFHYWCWQTMTGLTGVLLTFVSGIIFICSLSFFRRSLYNWFSRAHSLYPVFYILMVLHGTGRLVQEPYFQYFFVGPLILFVTDKIITITRKTIEIPILKAEVLPSGVTSIVFPKPPNFNYKSGQWVRIACPDLKTNESHPFTLSSAPHEPNLTLHIRAVGPWTTNIRNRLDCSRMVHEKLPTIRVDGPFGESHQNWDKYDIVIMIGGGIGVTPFASILKDIVYKSNQNVSLKCKKFYFLWVTRTQKQFEWMVDILRDLEQADVKNSVCVHIFITQFYQKFDLRTILLYICERHFQRISNKSLFTGLTAITHFGRPKFSQFFQCIQKLHPYVRKIGVLSCGTPSLTNAIDIVCKSLNLAETNETLFEHHFKSF